MPELRGRRVNVEPHEYEPGDFGRFADGWYGMTPNGLVANISGHTVTEHEDRTISAEPSILVNGGQENAWHGYLRRGVWSW